MTVRDPNDLDDLNPKPRNKMSVIKDGQEVSEVILQEGVPTYERMNDAVAEPVVYMIDRYVVGGFYRVHAERGNDENLNAPGASFVPLAFAESHRGESGIVYCATRKDTEAFAGALVDKGFNALPYHAGLDAAGNGLNLALIFLGQLGGFDFRVAAIVVQGLGGGF